MLSTIKLYNAESLDESLLSKSVDQFSIVKENEIPYIDELQKSVDFNTAGNQSAGSQLKLMINLINNELPD